MGSRWLVTAALLSLSLAAAPAAAQSPDSGLEAKVRDVAASLRCPVCQNLSIEDSPSQLARDMKQVVRQRLAAGETPDEVRRYFISRYGEWVLTKPRAAGVNLSVWLLPLVALLGCDRAMRPDLPPRRARRRCQRRHRMRWNSAHARRSCKHLSRSWNPNSRPGGWPLAT